MRRGGSFGTPGPDTGWALHLIEGAEIAERSPDLEALLATLMAARASKFGRAPTPEDLEVARLLCGLGEGLPRMLNDRRARWLWKSSHEKVKGKSALAEINADLLLATPQQVRYALTL
jgi:hypothetical protein